MNPKIHFHWPQILKRDVNTLPATALPGAIPRQSPFRRYVLSVPQDTGLLIKSLPSGSTKEPFSLMKTLRLLGRIIFMTLNTLLAGVAMFLVSVTILCFSSTSLSRDCLKALTSFLQCTADTTSIGKTKEKRGTL